MDREEERMDREEQVLVDPFRCRMWELHSRLDEYVTEENCRAELTSFEKHGQLMPVLGRRVSGDPDCDVELIYGARRLFVARQLNKPLRVLLRGMTDCEALVALDIENRQRLDVSPYERGLSYAKWLRMGRFESQEAIARVLGISAAQVSRVLKLAKLPSVIANAFEQPTDICEGWGADLVHAWEDESGRESLKRRARAIAAMSPRPPAHEVYAQLLGGESVRRVHNRKGHDEVVFDSNGVALFRVRRQRRAVTLVLPAQKTSDARLEAVKRAVSAILQGEADPGERRAEVPHRQLLRLRQRRDIAALNISQV